MTAADVVLQVQAELVHILVNWGLRFMRGGYFQDIDDNKQEVLQTEKRIKDCLEPAWNPEVSFTGGGV